MFWKILHGLMCFAANVYFFIFNENKKFRTFKNMIENKYKDYYIIMPIQPIGDLIIVCSSIGNLKRKRPGKYVVLVTAKNYDFVKYFKNIDALEIIDTSYVRYITFSYKIKLGKFWQKGKLSVINPDKVENKYNNIMELYSDLLSVECANNIFELLNFPKNIRYCNENTVLLSPLASSLNYKELSKKFWLNLASELDKFGYEVIFNAPNNYTDLFDCMYLPLSQVGEFAKTCKAVISFRSGFVDLVGLSNPQKLIVIYPKYFEHPKLKKIQKVSWLNTYNWNNKISEAENIINIMGVNVILPQCMVKEIIFKDNEKELMQDVMRYVNDG